MQLARRDADAGVAPPPAARCLADRRSGLRRSRLRQRPSPPTFVITQDQTSRSTSRTADAAIDVDRRRPHHRLIDVLSRWLRYIGRLAVASTSFAAGNRPAQGVRPTDDATLASGSDERPGGSRNSPRAASRTQQPGHLASLAGRDRRRESPAPARVHVRQVKAAAATSASGVWHAPDVNARRNCSLPGAAPAATPERRRSEAAVDQDTWTRRRRSRPRAGRCARRLQVLPDELARKRSAPSSSSCSIGRRADAPVSSTVDRAARSMDSRWRLQASRSEVDFCEAA